MQFSKVFIKIVFGGVILSIISTSCTTTTPVQTEPTIIESNVTTIKPSKNIQFNKDVEKMHWPFSITYDSDCPIRFSDDEIQEIVDIIPLEKNRIIRNIFINSPDTLSVWIVPTTTFYSGKERTYFLLKTDSGKWIVK